MNQKTKYYVLLLISCALVAIYFHDIQRVKDRVSSIQSSIKEMDQVLESGSTLLDDMNQIRTEFLNNKEILSSKKVSGAQLMNQLGEIKILAEKMDISFNDVEIDPRNTFPLISKKNGEKEIKIERHSVNFKLSGNFINIGRFIDEVEKNHSILQMQYCSVGLDSLDPKGVIADLGYLTYGESES